MLLAPRPVLFSNDVVNGYRLPDNSILMTEGYDWWWHNLVAVSRADGSLKPFFIEYYVVNPGLAQPAPIFGMNGTQKPSYALITAGTWGKDARKINNFYPVSQFHVDESKLDVTIGQNNTATETAIVGSVSMSEEAAMSHPEYFSDAGSIAWNLKAEKILSFDPGYPLSPIPRRSALFEMFWYVKGMRTRYSGTIEYNGQIYDVFPNSSYGYQDKNWGTEYTNPWIWLSTNKLVSRKTGKQLEYSSLDCGGGNPIVAGVPLGLKLLVAFYYEGKLYEYNFSKFDSIVYPEVKVLEDKVTWRVSAVGLFSKVELDFWAPKDTMINIRYESPRDGQIKHKKLWNTGYAQGTVRLYERRLGGRWRLVDTLDGDMGGAEYGEY
ncbi:hypothetical protein HDU84_006014 [Entophlyctis sp. JEL0112]|nr:hypothetical protein HDU84_006014 [Entophlyctis sp. JEL0112]